MAGVSRARLETSKSRYGHTTLYLKTAVMEFSFTLKGNAKPLKRALYEKKGSSVMIGFKF